MSDRRRGSGDDDRVDGRRVPTAVPEPAGRRYLRAADSVVRRLLDVEWPRIEAAASMVTAAIASGKAIHAFGSGHSHLLAEELFYRAGGLVGIRPILVGALMLHEGTLMSSALERLPGVAAALLADHPVSAGDVLILVSNSGGNTAIRELATLARDAGVRTIAITSIAHSTSPLARRADGPRLHEVVEIAIDNGGAPGDAAIEVEGATGRVGPTSTVAGAAIVNALVAEVVERLVAIGIVPAVHVSANLDGGDEAGRQAVSGDGGPRS